MKTCCSCSYTFTHDPTWSCLPYVFPGLVECARQTSNEILLKRRLLRGYDTSSRPVQNDSTCINVTIATSLYHILETVCFFPLFWVRRFRTINDDVAGCLPRVFWWSSVHIWHGVIVSELSYSLKVFNCSFAIPGLLSTFTLRWPNIISKYPGEQVWNLLAWSLWA
jgi:hypothetical protein